MAFCTSCGTPLAEGAAFCSNCGQRQNAAPAAPAYQSPVAEPVYEEATGLLSETDNVSLSDDTTLLSENAEPTPTAEPAYQPPVYEQPAYQQPAYQQPTYQPPVYQQPAYQQPAYQQYQPAPAPASANKGKSITAMVLGIVALFFSLFDLIYSFIGLAALGTWYGAEAWGGVLIVFSILTLGCAVPGMILGAGAATEGNTPAKLGKIFSLIGIIFGGIAFLMALICFAS